MTFWVYVLESEATRRRYIGHTDNLERRLAEHNCPEHNARKFTTRNQGRWRLVHDERYGTRAEAMRRERWLKSGVGRAWLNETIGRVSPPQAD